MGKFFWTSFDLVPQSRGRSVRNEPLLMERKTSLA